MRKLLAVLVLGLFAFAGNAASSDYFVDDNAVEEVLQSSTTVDVNAMNFDFQNAMKGTTSVEAGDNIAVALILNWFLGGLAIHRVYLGGRGTLILIYLVTCGGIFGIVPIVDFFSIAFGGIDDFVDNDKFIAW